MKDNILDESIYTRVTTPLKKYSGLEEVPELILDYASDRGRRVHEYCKKYALDVDLGEIDEDCFPYVQAYIHFHDQYIEEVIHAEKRFFCDELKIQGEPDIIAKVKGYDKACVIDTKTSSKTSKTWEAQTAAYKYLCIVNGIEISTRIVAHIHKDETFDVIDYQDDKIPEKYENDLIIYTSCLMLHRHFFDKKRKKSKKV